MAIIVDPDQITEGDEVTTNTTLRTVTIAPGSSTNLPLASDGIALQALYSWYKEEWKDVSNRMRYPFLLEAITPEQMEFRKDWILANDVSIKAIRTGGFRFIDTDNSNQIKKEYVGIVTLGTFEDTANDTAYYQLGTDPTDTAAATDFDFAGPVNEPILSYNENYGPDATGLDFIDGGGSNDQIQRPTGSWITDGYKIGAQITILNASTSANDGTYEILDISQTVNPGDTIDVATASLTADTTDTTATAAVNYRNAITLFLRVRDGDAVGKTFAQAALSDIGVTEVDNKVFRFPLSNAPDLDITETDANIASLSPYTEIVLRYFDQAFTTDVDSTTPRNFGIVVDVGTHSGVDGSFSAAGSVLTSAEGGIPTDATYTGGTLIIHEGTDKGTEFTISGTPTATTVTITGSFTGTESDISFSIQRATPVVADKNEIYEKVQYLLRQSSDIDSTTSGVVAGDTADELLTFVGPDLIAGGGIPNNPNGGGSGVIIVGFDSNDTNNLSFFDNAGTEYSYPFVSAGTILFNNNLQNDTGSPKYFMYYEYTERFTNTGFGISAVSGAYAILDSSTTDLVTELSSGDFIKLGGFTNEENNGWWQLTGAPTGAGPYAAPIVKTFDASLPTAEAASASVSLDKNPIDTDDAIVVQNNSSVDISGIIAGASVSFDFDYDNNVQGGRTAGSDAAIIIRAIGLDKAQFVETSGTITQATGLSFSLVSALERNYLNP